MSLSGCYLTDTTTNRFKFVIPAGYTVPPHGFLLVWADANTSTNGDPDLHIGFKLNKGGETIGLSADDGTPLDFVSYGPQMDDISQGRYPDGASPFYFMPAATPGTNNIIPEATRLMAQIGASFVHLAFNSQPGSNYQVQFKDDLDDAAWVPLGLPLLGNGAQLQIDAALTGQLHRFYRLVVVP